MARALVKNRKGTPREEAENASGYVSSGAGEYSRKVAGGRTVKVGDFEDHVPLPRPERWRTVDEQIARVNRELKKTLARLAAGGLRHERRAVLESNVDIKRKFLARLQTE